MKVIIFSAVDDLDIGKREKQRFFWFLIDCLMFFGGAGEQKLGFRLGVVQILQSLQVST